MTLTVLAIFSLAAVIPALLYLLLARSSSLNNGRVPVETAANGELASGPPSPERDAVAEAHWRRAEILLQNGRLDAAVADCRQALAMAPDHPEAKALWDHLFSGEPVAAQKEGVALLRAAIKDKST